MKRNLPFGMKLFISKTIVGKVRLVDYKCLMENFYQERYGQHLTLSVQFYVNGHNRVSEMIRARALSGGGRGRFTC